MKTIRIIVTALILTTLLQGQFGYAEGDNHPFQTGDYFQLGQYCGEPILWRSVICDDEEFNKERYPSNNNDKLMLYSDRILCFKAFDISEAENDPLTNFWEDSKLREWLNSNIDSNKSYDGEPGFLSENNFTKGERGAIRQVTLKTFLPRSKINSTSGSDIFENCGTVFRYPFNDTSAILYSVKEIEFMDSGGEMGETQDRIFLLDEIQVYNIYTHYRTASAEVASSLKDVYTKENYNYAFWLRTPFNGWQKPYIGDDSDVCILCGEDADRPYIKKQNGSLERYSFEERGDKYFYTQANDPQGVRPAFYLDQENTIVLSGTGSKEDPYVITGNPILQVFCNGEEMEFDQRPFGQNETAYIPVRQMMERLGAEVNWEEQGQKIKIQKDDKTVEVAVDMQEIYINGELGWLPAPVILRNDRTLVPLQVLTAGFGISAEWDSDAQKVTISNR